MYICTPWTVAFQAPLSMGFSKQEYWSGFTEKSQSFTDDRAVRYKTPEVEVEILSTVWKKLVCRAKKAGKV